MSQLVGFVRLVLGALDHDDRVRPGGERRTGHDPRRGAGLDRGARQVAGHDLFENRQACFAPLQIGGHHGESVDDRFIVRRRINVARHVFGQYGAVRVGQRKGAGWQRRRLRENQGQGFVDREHKRSLAAGRGGRPANGQERAAACRCRAA